MVGNAAMSFRMVVEDLDGAAHEYFELRLKLALQATVSFVMPLNSGYVVFHSSGLNRLREVPFLDSAREMRYVM